ncbi:S41 family peptidase [uncultured Pontibacter sp.]|uniref:S41 family peptidase n=1 Tax=uncultured Pontibacter sp. TaxID=453356 RepID=UPI002624FE0E|nr:S41 family peptidase [uncultured Pontibacter sp.]
MLQKLLVSLCICFAPSLMLAQKKPTETQRLATLGKTWGLLKYHNPNLAKGTLDWDSVLVAHVPTFQQAKTRKALNKAVQQLILAAGPKADKPAPLPDTSQLFMKNYDMAWTKDQQLFDKKTRQQLQDVILYRHNTDSTHYIRPHPTGSVFTNEKAYREMQYPETEYRLLSLFRYWNTIHYFFPYKYLTDKSWNNVLEEYIPQFLTAEDAVQYTLTTAKLVKEIDDTHGFFQSPVFEAYLGEYRAPFMFAILNDQLVVHGLQDSVMRVHDILPGDVITHVGGRDVKDLIKEREQYSAFSNQTGRNYNILPMHLLRGHTNELEITFTRGGKVTTKKIKRYKQEYGLMSLSQQYTSNPAAKEVSPSIGYILNARINSQAQADSIYKAMANYKAIIYDLRPNTDHTLRWHMAHLLSEPTPFFNGTFAKISIPGTFNWLGGSDHETQTGPESNPSPFQGRLYILVGPYTFSLGEFTAMALQTVPNAKVIGSQTAGADGDVKRIILPGSISTMISGLGIYYPDRTQTQRIGIVPDVEVKLTSEDFQVGKDTVLQHAIELAEKETKGL